MDDFGAVGEAENGRYLVGMVTGDALEIGGVIVDETAGDNLVVVAADLDGIATKKVAVDSTDAGSEEAFAACRERLGGPLIDREDGAAGDAGS